MSRAIAMCNDCGHAWEVGPWATGRAPPFTFALVCPLKPCPKCGGENIDAFTRFAVSPDAAQGPQADP